MKAFVPLLAMFAATFAIAAPATASADDLSVQADLNGDGQLDTVAIQPIAGDPDNQRLVATVGGATLTATMPLNVWQSRVQPLRVVDLDGDGWDEIVVTETVGANTLSFTVWGLFGGLNPVVGPDLTTPLRLWEGGGLAAVSRYRCEPAGSGRELVTVLAEPANPDWSIYEGERVTYAVHNGVATETSRTSVTGPRDDPEFQYNAETCA
jgi:hypothetical protein